MTPAVVAGLALGLTWWLTGRIRRYAVRRALLDHPNARSSHDRPIPRGGGLAVVLVMLGGMLLLALAGWMPVRTAVALAGGGAAVAAVGWMDDLRSLPAGVRAAVHFFASVWALAWLDGLPQLRWGTAALPLGAAGWPLGILGIMWAVNLFNFMDGIDGLAGGEAVIVALVAGLVLGAGGHPTLIPLLLLLAGSAAGFLVWNWPPARIFLGDVGSGFLGFLFGALAVASENSGALPAVGWILLLGAFFFDATLTVARRMARGERWYQAHRRHAYQRAVQGGLTHGRVTASVLGMDLLLGAAAWLGWSRQGLMPLALLAAVAGLSAVYLSVERRRPMYPAE